VYVSTHAKRLGRRHKKVEKTADEKEVEAKTEDFAVEKLAPAGMVCPWADKDERGIAEKDEEEIEREEKEREERKQEEDEIQKRELEALARQEEKIEEEIKQELNEIVKELEEEASWEVPKHPIHVTAHAEEGKEGNSEKHQKGQQEEEAIPAAENNPFAKLAELDSSAASMDMGMPSM